ncbi:hypothetical protein XA68_13143 [Ophiocordyceps unilateralis]|uniref:SH3 domain-containing protein n=1 Tax=Ophiocordyceps unilateralis TaxID=268505 RepID=A0A2A9PNC6_OPHUN|nr:hypothetical protein XA68_13143 [Ophiocordyceps unilateralis]
MTRPNIIRADTIDLQDHQAPSAKDHPNSVPGLSAASPARHHADTLREVALETAEEEARCPRASWSDGSGGRFDVSHDELVGPGGDIHSLGLDPSVDMNDHDDQHDALAIAQNGGLSSSDEGDADADADLDDDLMDKISSSPSIEDEDIDFEFVYALHTFVATVEGQANATKGDTMMLLDDSNSYWWLVRVVKDSSIGYLPAEHIETPTERLARLNKHRNIDLSATMLGDQAQKAKNNSFKTMRRRRKTVAFAEPTYVDYSDFEYSTEEEDVDGVQGAGSRQADDQQKQDGSQPEDEVSDEGAKVEPLKPRSNKEEKTTEPTKEDDTDAEEARDSDDSTDNKPDGPSRSRNGTVRNTDSFFKDESVETKKITLTPNLLRDDNASRESTESSTRDIKPMTSSERLEKELAPDKEKKKGKDKEKREKERKPSAIRSFFTRKDKKKTADDDDDSLGKRSMDTLSDSRDSEDRWDEHSPVEKSTSKISSKMLKMGSTAGKGPTPAPQKSVELVSYLAESRTNDMSNVPPASMRIVDPETRESQEVPSNQQQRPRDAPRARSLSTGPAQREGRSTLSKIIPARSASAGPEGRQKTVKAKTRTPLESSDVSDVSGAEEADKRNKGHRTSPSPAKGREVVAEEDVTKAQQPNGHRDGPSVPQQQPRRNMTERSQASPRLESSSHPPALVADTSSRDGNSTDASPSPDQAQGPSGNNQRMEGSSAQREPAWDDTKLRAFFDEGDHIRDLLAVVYDKSDVEPAGSDHPVVGGLFREQNAKLAEITTQLDNMLGDWLARKQRLRGTI